ncbi:metallophosphoesterase family protein [Nocardia wallacei]|uniref:metallophosphoesterase family protein n=1 Tax=Nocardia wallacei TaxID=480035 RepID=UPI002458A2B7|nr:metallophosphoesterase [Nocardia wallacei]
MGYGMSCCGPNRRHVLRALGLAAAAPLLATSAPGSARAQPGSLIATDLEVVTVTATSVVLTWTTLAVNADGTPIPADTNTEVRLAPADSRGPATVHFPAGAERTPYHYAEVDGLEPGRPYRFEAWSDGVRATPAANLVTRMPTAPECTGEFTTLVPPPGRRLRTLALCNDVHFGEEVSGLIAAGLPPGVRQDPGLTPYPEMMLAAVLDDLRRPDRAADHLLLAGDLTSEATPDQTHGVRSQLDAWGAAGRDWFAVRGNHDRPHTGNDYATCPPIADDHHDCWGESFTPPGEVLDHQVGGLRLLGLDTTDLDTAGGRIDRPQLDRIRELLHADPHRPTLVFGHHPVTLDSAVSNIAGPSFVLNRPDATALQALYSTAPGVFLHHSGHTHRNRRSPPDTPLQVEFIEVAAVKEYPGGYTLLHLHEGGYQLNFYKTRSPQSRTWSTKTRSEYLGLQPEYTLGPTTTRNHVVHKDLSGLT